MLSWPRHTEDKSDGAGSTVLTPHPAPRRPVVGLALGAGAARGWAHLGVIAELAANDIHPEVVAGTSIGAVVGACYVTGKTDDLEHFARSLTKRRVMGYMDWSLSGMGLISGRRLREMLEKHMSDLTVEAAPKRFATVATEVGSGHEIWLTRGNMVNAVCASYALPGIFEPVRIGSRWLMDGALVNPVPVTVCRALGADCVIAVNLVGDTLYRGTVITDPGPDITTDDIPEPLPAPRGRSLGALRLQFGRRADGAPGLMTTMMDAFNITQDRISRSRLAGDPPDVMLNLRVPNIGLFDFHRAEELIEAGRETVRRSLHNLVEHVSAVG